jgi:hypothetical protein
MKIRLGFVSNSSSSSFIIGKSKLTVFQLEQIKNHMEIAKVLNIDTYYDEWNRWDITEEDDYIKGFTNMDNFDMETFLRKIGVKDGDIEWWHS